MKNTFFDLLLHQGHLKVAFFYARKAGLPHEIPASTKLLKTR